MAEYEPEARRIVDISPTVGGWQDPWPNVAELASVLPTENWTLIGGLMTQLHTIHYGLGVVRPTNDVDIALHIETKRGVPFATANALEELGYRSRPAVDPRDNTAHRWFRGVSTIDVVTSVPETEGREDVVDVVTAEHAAPRVQEKMRGRDMVQVEGGTQALRRTINARLEIVPGQTTVISVPRPSAAVILKSAAHRTDSRDRERHLFDAAALLACIEDPFEERTEFAGSDLARLRHLAVALPHDHPAWTPLTLPDRQQAQAALRIMVK